MKRERNAEFYLQAIEYSLCLKHWGFFDYVLCQPLVQVFLNNKLSLWITVPCKVGNIIPILQMESEQFAQDHVALICKAGVLDPERPVPQSLFSWHSSSSVLLFILFISFIFLSFKKKLLYFFFYFLAMPQGRWDLSSPTGNRTCTPCSGSLETQMSDHQESPYFLSFMSWPSIVATHHGKALAFITLWYLLPSSHKGGIS